MKTKNGLWLLSISLFGCVSKPPVKEIKFDLEFGVCYLDLESGCQVVCEDEIVSCETASDSFIMLESHDFEKILGL